MPDAHYHLALRNFRLPPNEADPEEPQVIIKKGEKVKCQSLEHPSKPDEWLRDEVNGHRVRTGFIRDLMGARKLAYLPCDPPAPPRAKKKASSSSEEDSV